jgi:hypothetical protein
MRWLVPCFSLMACGDADVTADEPPRDAAPLAAAVIDGLSMERVRDDVDLLASDEQGGRVPGSPGHLFTRDTLAAEMATAGLQPLEDGFVVEHELQLGRNRWGLDENGEVVDVPLDQPGYHVVGMRPGTESDEVVLLMAHYDHLGVTVAGDVYNGAFDNATAVSALLELARVLDEQDVSLRRNLVFLFTDAEEDGLDGAEAWIAAPLLPLDDVVAAISVDPIGRPILTDFMPLVAMGSERSPELAAAVDAVAPFVETPFHRANRAPLVGFGSDQDAFWDAPSPVPALWISSGGMSFYHTVDDDPQTIDYRSVRTHLESIAQLAAHLADSDVRPVDQGLQVVSVDDLAQAVDLLEQALLSSELNSEELAILQDYLDLFSAGVGSGDVSAPQYPATYAEMLQYMIAELTPNHPGPIPPPFPE